MLHRQVAEETARAIAQACTPILSPMSAFLGKSLSVVCFISSFYLIFWHGRPASHRLRRLDKCDMGSRSDSAAFGMHVPALRRSFSKNGIEKRKEFNTARCKRNLLHDTMGSYRTNDARDSIDNLSGHQRNCCALCILDLLLRTQNHCDRGQRSSSCCALSSQNSPYGVVFFAVLFVIVITLYAVVQNKKSASTCNKESALTFDGADQILSWQQTECMVDPFRYALRTKSNKSWFDFLFDEICASGSHDTAC